MHKTWLIIKREYLTRVKKKSFLVITLLVPIVILAFVALPALLINNNKGEQHIAVIDNSQIFNNNLKDGNSVYFKFLPDKNVEDYKKQYQQDGYTGLLYIPKIDISQPKGFVYYGSGQLGIDAHLYIEDQLDKAIENKRMTLAGIDQSKLDAIKADVSLTERTGADEKSSNVLIATAIATVCGFLTYFLLLFFGMSVMRGVMEEKISRIAEVIISSVKPFQLMFGKIVGIAGVGLTQFIIWLVLIIILFTGLGSIAPDVAHHAQQMHQSQGDFGAALGTISQKVTGSNINFPLLIICFFFYFLGGYLLYASLFAAVGSVVDQESSDAQSLTFPITLPIIISFFIMFSAVQQPNSPLAIGASLFPLSSPLVMIARIPFGVPWWQILISMSLLVLTFLFTTWMAGKIYRTGILLYGKKVTLKEMGKWLVRKS